ncbi:DNA-binding transcriptional regulator, LysR family [Saccharopolyspora antimicrobica]|uniref:DNA-binding transcriptional LysR family regulator n=1 Tax=Saccharopolyspora antimicrobica TaxID=455193 RepID=A0A1I4V4J0_9PSEU|nr:LysR substrate-binding domain-containing protein [Saccharopolyspora antimicrobica]RKT86120.1 DNA-binding transcriptional LysR family regulator [Saccharopolyspora antimicrobica]SFM96053.1 DNA-binding transcriptional regulator, LysR family [Saccharopolyspora antimicrobica]
MDLLPLRYFQVVARHEHISRAAVELRVSQPSLSRTIARLEKELGVPLFDRQGRQIRLNSYGAAFLARVDRALRELDDGRQELSDTAGPVRGSVAVASETLLTLASSLPGFRTKYPDVDVRLYQSSGAVMQERLRRGEVDLGLASQRIDDPALETAEVLRDEVLLAVPTGHPLASRTSARITDLAGEPVVTTTGEFWLRQLLDRLFAAAGQCPNIVCEGNELGATAFLISMGLGVGFVPVMAARYDQAGVTFLRVEAPDCYRVLTFAWRRDAYLSVAAQRFRDHTTESLRSEARN